MIAALPFLLAAIGMGVVLAEYVSGDIRLTQRVRSAATWPLYEMLAVLYASLLPLALTVAGFVSVLLGGRGRGSRGELAGSVLLLLPLGLVAWSMVPDVPGGGWMFVAFLGFALARLIAHRTHRGMLEDGAHALLACAREGAWRYGLGTAAFLLSAFLILPLEPIFGFEMPSVEHGQYYLMLGIGVVYFLLSALVELLPMRRIVNGIQAAGTAAQPASEPTA